MTDRDEMMIPTVTAQVTAQIRASAAYDEQQAARLRERTAEGWEAAAAIKRQVADILDGRGLTAAQVAEAGPLGMKVGPLPLFAPPADAPLEVLEQHRLLLERVYEVALRQMQRTRDEITRRRSTLDTAQLAPEDIPRPDPLTAHPAEDSGAHPVVGAAGAHRPVPDLDPAPEAAGLAGRDPNDLADAVPEPQQQEPEGAYPARPAVALSTAGQGVPVVAGPVAAGTSVYDPPPESVRRAVAAAQEMRRALAEEDTAQAGGEDR